MKAKRSLFIGLIIGVLLGWVLGFLRIPYLEKNLSFLLGFLLCLTLISLLIALSFVWKRSSLPALWTGKNSRTENAANSGWKYSVAWIAMAGFIVAAGGTVILMLYRHNEAFKTQSREQKSKVKELTALIESVKKSNLEFMMRNVLDDVGRELQDRDGRTLSDTAITRITALSFSCKPYKYFEEDSFSKKELSPERGQLLQALVLLNIDSASFARIKRSAHFTAADLKGADLKGLDLSGINLKGANLKDANLSAANLSKADLSNATLWGARLNKANLNEADLRKTDLRWAELNDAYLQSANLDGADLTNAQLRKADLSGASIQWAQSGGALLNAANLTQVNCFGASMSKANLSEANLSDTDLRKINLSEADLIGAVLTRALVDKNLLEQLNGWRVIGTQEIQKNYQVVNDSMDKWKQPLYRLQKI